MEPSDIDYIEIPGVDHSDVDNIDIPGVDVDIQESQVIDIFDPGIPTTDPAPTEPVLLHQVAEVVETILSVQQVET